MVLLLTLMRLPRAAEESDEEADAAAISPLISARVHSFIDVLLFAMVRLFCFCGSLLSI